jgi:hypothetical protein
VALQEVISNGPLFAKLKSTFRLLQILYLLIFSALKKILRYSFFVIL